MRRKGHNQDAGGVWARLNSLTHSTLDPRGAEVNCAGAWRGSMIQLHGRVRGIADCLIAPVSVPFGGEKDSDAKSTGGGRVTIALPPGQQVDAGKRDGLVTLVTYSAGVRSRAGRSTQDSAAPTGSGVGGDLPSLTMNEEGSSG